MIVTPSDWIAVGALIVAGLSLVVSVTTVVLSYRERTTTYRLRVYGEQVTALSEIAHALTNHHRLTQQLLSIMAPPALGRRSITDEERVDLREDSWTQWHDLISAEMRKSFFLPEVTIEVLADYRRVFLGLTAPQANAEYPVDLVANRDPAARLAESFTGVLAVFRGALNVDTLSEATPLMLGKTDDIRRPTISGT